MYRDDHDPIHILIGHLLIRCVACATALVATGLSAQVVPPAPPPAPRPLDDRQFDAALPPLEATTVPGAATAPAPTVPTAALPPVSPPDPELTAPLPTLSQAQTVPPAAPAGSADDAQLPAIRYTVETSGLKEIGLDARFKPLSALLRDGRKAANAAQISARADEDVALVERLLHSEGYYDGVASATVDPQAATPGRAPAQARVSIVATPGRRYALGTIALTGAAPSPTVIARSALGLTTGQPIVATDIVAAEARVALSLPEQGYPFATVGARSILLDDARPVGDYTLPITSGARSRFGGFRVAGDPVFGPDHIAVLSRFKPGQIYDSRKVDDLRQALVGTSLFSTVAVQPVRTGVVDADGTEVVDLRVDQTAGPRRSLAGSAGYGTGEGIKLTGSWTHRNLFPDEGALTVAAVAGTQEQSLSTIFRRSNAGLRDRTFQASAAVSREDRAAFSARSFNLAASLSRQSTPIWQKRWTYSIGGELIATDESRAVLATGDRTRSTYFIAALPGQVSYDRSNSLLDPTKGYRLSARISPEASLQGGLDSYVRTLFEGSAYMPVAGSIVIAGRARVGSIVGVARDAIAPSRRLYSGGGGSVRGFGYQQLGPKDANNDPVGGRSLTEFALEARYRFGDYGIVPFFDAGRVGEASTPSLSGLRYGAGIGGRYYTNFGPLRIDLATPLKRQPGESKLALYISIGQAF